MEKTICSVKKLLTRYRHAWILSYGLVYLTWFFYLESQITEKTSYHIMHTALDDMIPFCEYFIVPYLLWFGYVVVTGLYFMVTSKDEFYRLCAFLFTGMTISLVICSFFPNGTDLRPVFDENKNIFTRIVAGLYRTDTCTNVFPSIHVFNSIGVNAAIHRSEVLEHRKYGSAVRSGSTVLCVLICLSTMFLKQHSVLDVAGAIILASILYGAVYGYPVMEAQTQLRRERKLRKTYANRLNG